jgi:hypothetical protein
MNLPGIFFCLQKPGHYPQMPFGGSGCLRLQAQELHVVGGECVRVLLPPAPLVGILGEREELAPARLGHSVEIEQLLDLFRREA